MRRFLCVASVLVAAAAIIAPKTRVEKLCDSNRCGITLPDGRSTFASVNVYGVRGAEDPEPVVVLSALWTSKSGKHPRYWSMNMKPSEMKVPHVQQMPVADAIVEATLSIDGKSWTEHIKSGGRIKLTMRLVEQEKK